MTDQIANLIQALSVAFAALSVALGISAWRREFVGKRRIELVESTLSLFYQAQDAIAGIRNPFWAAGEGSSRPRRDGEDPELANEADKNYVVFERYKSREALFSELRASRYSFMAAFGPTTSAPFDEISKVVREILVASRMLNEHYWHAPSKYIVRQEREQDRTSREKFEAVIWLMGEDDDPIAARVRAAVGKVEEITSREANPPAWHLRLWRWRRSRKGQAPA